MNKLTIENGGYVLVRDYDDEVFEGESTNLLAVFDVDTFTLLDKAYNRKPIAILNCLFQDVEVNGSTYGSLAELEQAYNDAIEKSQGGGSDIPEPAEGDEGKVLTVGDDLELEWAETESGLPEVNPGDEGKVLTVNDDLELEWKATAPEKHIITNTAQMGIEPVTVLLDGNTFLFSDLVNLYQNDEQIIFKYLDTDSMSTLDCKLESALEVDGNISEFTFSGAVIAVGASQVKVSILAGESGIAIGLRELATNPSVEGLSSDDDDTYLKYSHGQGWVPGLKLLTMTDDDYNNLTEYDNNALYYTTKD